MLALAFLNPLLLWAVPLCAVPIVIHLLNRRRFHRVPWAAMEYLLAAMKRNRKRLRMEQWLVLLLRTLAVLLLVFLVCRPQLGGGGLLGVTTHHVVLLDDSASTTQRSGSGTLYGKAQDRVRALADDLSQRRTGDLFSLVRTSRPDRPDLWAQHVGPELGRRIGTLLKELPAGDGAVDLGLALQATLKRAASVEQASKTRIWIAGDCRATDWRTDEDKPRPAMLAALRALRQDQDHLTVLGGSGPPGNLAITGVRLLDRLCVAAVPSTLAVDVQNLGLDPTPATTVAVEVDGQSRITLTVPPLSPGEPASLPLGHTFHHGGYHRVDARLEATDTYPLDDQRTLVLDVRDKSRALLVDGQPDEEGGDTFFLQAAMEGLESGIEPQVVGDMAFDETPLEPFDIVWLCNVQSPGAEACKRLSEFVAAGGGLVVTCGPLVDTTVYDERLWRNGEGPLALPLGEIAGDPDRPEKAVLVNKEHAVCDRVGEVLDLLLPNVVLVKRWLSVVEPPGHGAAVVARIHDAEGPPLLVTRTTGKAGGGVGGESALLAISADKAWSNLPSTDLFVVLANQLHRACARRQDLAPANLLPDGSYRLSLDPGTYRADATLRALRSDDERTFTASEQPASGPATIVIPMSELRVLGAYEVELARHDGVAEKRLLARNPAIAESRLVGFTDKGFARTYPAELHDRVVFVRDEGGGAGDEGDGEGEAWHLLAALLLAGLLLESLLAWRFGRR